jgi:hypothetical protein
MFGRQMGEFGTWTNQLNENEEAELFKRSVQIRQRCETTVPKALEYIKKSQDKQIKNQNSQHNITNERLPEGTKVFIKSPKIKAKLEADYLGPFTIIGHTKKGNYWIKNRAEKRLPQSYPLSRLKIVDDEVTDDTFYDVETILKDRVTKFIKEYFFKWKGYPDSDNS